MSSVDVFIRYSSCNVHLDKVATLSQEGQLVYDDGGDKFEAHGRTALKFTLLTAASPLICLVHLVRCVALGCLGYMKQAGRELVGALVTPLLLLGCLSGSLLASVLYPVFPEQLPLRVAMRRTYAYFEAWINGIELNAPKLPSYSQRVSGFWEVNNRVWTTAPCMQPMLENGLSNRGGLLDPSRIRRLFPFVRVNGIAMEGDKVVIQSEYANENIHHTVCGGACERKKRTDDCCCYYRIEAIYDRILCCEVARGNCSSKYDSRNSCGIALCQCCGLSACCCYTQQEGNVTALNAGLGCADSCCITTVDRSSA